MASLTKTLVAVMAIAFVLSTPAFARTPEAKLAHLVNHHRRKIGVEAVHRRERLDRYAERHSRRMVRAGELFHSTLDYYFRRVAGENVGVGGTVHAVFLAFLASPSHREIIEDPDYGWTGVGVVRSDGLVWITQEFAG